MTYYFLLHRRKSTLNIQYAYVTGHLDNCVSLKAETIEKARDVDEQDPNPNLDTYNTVIN